MTIRELYEFAIERGIALDPRGEAALREQMEQARAEQEALSEAARVGVDTERTRNPFGDTRIVCGDPQTQVRRIVCGIDITGAEILMADRLRDHGQPVDLVVAHHTSAIGGGLGSRRDTIWPQVKMATDFGVPEHLAWKLVSAGAQGGPERSVDFRITQIAEGLGMPLITLHSPPDLYLFAWGRKVIEEDRPRTLGDLVARSNAAPEVRWLHERGQGTEIAVGDAKDPLGRVYFAFYGGWNPTPEMFEALCDAGCGTLWVVATSGELNEVARRRKVSIVVTPHYPADNIGLNGLFDDAMARFGPFEIVPSGNYVRTIN